MLDETLNPNPDSNTPLEPVTPPPSLEQPPINLLTNQAYIESERERMRLFQENEQLRSNQPKAPQNFDAANQSFFDKPAESMARLVNEEVTRTIAPIAAEFRQFTRMQAYQTLKNTYRQIPNFNLIEGQVDQIMANLEPTAANMNGAISMAVGQMTLQGQSFMQQSNTLQTKITPPNLPPSPPAPPANTNAANKIQLTEMQKRVARENNMTDEQYISYLTADSKEVVTMEKK